jgi:regulator of RNase E activity RraA
VVGDRDGVVVVPRRLLAEVTGRIAAIVKKEEAMFSAITKDSAKPDAMASIFKEATIRYVE